MTKNIECTCSYLSQNIDRFPFAELQSNEEENLFEKPDNRKHILFINKGITGCGGTTLVAETALKERLNVVCVLPSVSAVQSKELQFMTETAVQCIYGSKRLYTLKPHNVIFATYDQINNILLFLGEGSSNFLLVVDEYHTFTRDVFRNRAMRSVLESFKSFASVTLLSATPDKYLEETIEKIYSDYEISRLNFVWPYESRRVTVYEAGKVQKALISLVNKFKNNEDSPNLYIMLNSITAAQGIIAKTRLNPSEYHIHCSKSQEEIINRSDIEDINSNIKKINFITSAGFEGCDIKDPFGVIITVVNVDSPTCMFDWQTLVQMQGRCRGSIVEPAVIYHSDGTLNEETKIELNHRMEELKMKNRRLRSMTFEELNADEDTLILNNKPVINPFSVAQVQRRLEVATSMLSVSEFVKYLKEADYTVAVKEVKIAKKGQRVQVQSFKKQVYSFINGQYEDLHDIKLIETLIEKYGKDKLIQMIEELNYSKSQLKRLVTATSKNQIENYHTILGLHNCTWYSNANIKKRIEFLNEVTGTEYGTRYIGNTLMEMGYKATVDKRTVGGRQVKGYFVVDTFCTIRPSLELKLYKEMSSIEGLKIQTADIKLSIATYKGDSSAYFRCCTLTEALNISKLHPTDIKAEQYYIGEGYDNKNKYRRLQVNLRYLDCIILDIDNGGSIEDFNNYVDTYLGGAFHYLYETHSSKPEHNKFRVIFPLTSTITFDDEDYVRAYKKTKIQLFPDFQDSNCPMWVFAPYKEVKTFGNENVLLDSEVLTEVIDSQYVYDKAIGSINKDIWTSEEEYKAIEDARAKHSSKESIVKRINEAVAPVGNASGNREHTIFRAVNWLKKEDIEWVYNHIQGSTPADTEFRRKCFKEKVDRRMRGGWKHFGK